jgi:lipopolysaccharide export system protein LptA
MHRIRDSLFIGLLFIQGISIALPDDGQQILHVRAGSADINQQTHEGIYLNQVELDQGSTHIRASEATTHTDEKNKLVVAIIKGNATEQAHYWALPSTDKPEVHAYADTIKYYPERHFIELIGHARVEQGDNSFSAPRIRYDMIAQHVQSTTDTTGARTTIIFHPETKS